MVSVRLMMFELQHGQCIGRRHSYLVLGKFAANKAVGERT